MPRTSGIADVIKMSTSNISNGTTMKEFPMAIEIFPRRC